MQSSYPRDYVAAFLEGQCRLLLIVNRTLPHHHSAYIADRTCISLKQDHEEFAIKPQIRN